VVEERSAGRLVSVNVGKPRDVAWRGRTVHTGVWKEPVDGPVMARRLNLDGDGQGDLGGHGGEMRAVMVYQLDSYRYWQRVLDRDDLGHGCFGENFTVEGLPDDEVCIGDRYRIGDAVFEVSQPRVTCYRVGIRLDEPRIPALLVADHRPGFYLRVVTEGLVRAGDEIVPVAAGPERMTVAEIDALLYLPGHTRRQLDRALRIPALSPGWQASFRALREESTVDSSGNAGLTAVAGPPPAWPGFRRLAVTAVDRESDSVFSLRLADPSGAPLPAGLPGQFLTVRVRPDGPDRALLRSYSMSGEPSAPGYRISVKREPHGAASGYLHDHVRPGDRIEVAAPRGSFTLRSGAAPVLLISAGVGATPVLAMLHALAAAGSTRQVWWLHGARSRAEQPFATESRTLLAALPHARTRVFYSHPEPGDGAAGRLDPAALLDLGLPTDAEAYLCGPAGFMHDLSAALVALGLDGSRIHTEIFGPESALTPGIAPAPARPPHPPAGPAGGGRQVAFARSGLTVPWDDSFDSLLELAEACDVPTRWSCRTGVCHTCETRLISGTVDYLPDPVEAPADGDLLICCARPTTELVLDL
jgi:ferredoxin-NADP reductase/MOSC domain-containing protein YiiM